MLPRVFDALYKLRSNAKLADVVRAVESAARNAQENADAARSIWTDSRTVNLGQAKEQYDRWVSLACGLQQLHSHLTRHV